jgi:Domain of unknown function (DUF6484)
MSRVAKRQQHSLREARAEVTAMPGPIFGRIAKRTPQGFTVDFPGNPNEPALARSTVAFGELARAYEAEAHPEVLLLFEANSPARPVIVGLAAPPIAPEAPAVAVLDGRRVVLEGKDEVILKCGKAVIVMRRNGRIVVRGTYIETDSAGVNRIKGGSVQLE